MQDFECGYALQSGLPGHCVDPLPGEVVVVTGTYQTFVPDALGKPDHIVFPMGDQALIDDFVVQQRHCEFRTTGRGDTKRGAEELPL